MNQLTHSDISNGSSELIHCPTISPSNGWVYPKYFIIPINLMYVTNFHAYINIYIHIHVYIYISMYVCIYLSTCLSIYLCMYACMHACMYVFVCVWVWGQPLFPRDLRIVQFFSFKAGGASSPSSLAPTKTLDECWWYLTWSVRRTCHVTISISEFCDSLTAATVLSLSLFKTCLGPTAFSRAKKYKSIWASWTDILSYKCMYVCIHISSYCHILSINP